MSLRDDLAGVLARDPRYPIQAYVFVFEALEFTKKQQKRRVDPKARTRGQAAARSRHVTGRELCEGARLLALRDYGFMAMSVLNLWGIRATADIGEIVYNLIASGDLETTPTDSRSDFDRVYEFDDVFRRSFVLALDEVA